jgi:Asp-tRNA(Asn)/Glu-tRNA(Gln) amidotransferase A subunit family amidase
MLVATNAQTLSLRIDPAWRASVKRRAQAIDEALAHGEPNLPLAGVPFAVKICSTSPTALLETRGVAAEMQPPEF